MRVEQDDEVVERTTLGPEEKPGPSLTDSTASIDPSPSRPLRQERQNRGDTYARGRSARGNKRKDMGRGEWRYVDTI